jgi:SNF2 family DNA or RNA helicase
VDDEAAKKEKGYRSAGEESEDDSLLSISAITKQMASQTLNDKPVTSSQASASDADAGYSSSTDSEGVDASSIRHNSDSEADDDDIDPYTRPGTRVLASAKISELLRLLRAEASQHKFIVFSQFTTMLDLIEPFLRREGFKFSRYDGSMRNEDREESLRQLRKEESCRVLLCSLKCGSLGLNLTAATRVVIVEPFWNPVSQLPT